MQDERPIRSPGGTPMPLPALQEYLASLYNKLLKAETSKEREQIQDEIDDYEIQLRARQAAESNAPQDDTESSEPPGAGSVPYRSTLEVLREIRLADETKQFFEWLNRQAINRQVVGAIGPSSLLFFLVGWCESEPNGLSRFVNEQFAGTAEESISQAIRSLQPYRATPSNSRFPYLTHASEEVLRKAKQLIEGLRRDEIRLHHLFAAFLQRAAEEKSPDDFLGLSGGRVQTLRSAYLPYLQKSGFGEPWEYWKRELGTVAEGARSAGGLSEDADDLASELDVTWAELLKRPFSASVKASLELLRKIATESRQQPQRLLAPGPLFEISGSAIFLAMLLNAQTGASPRISVHGKGGLALALGRQSDRSADLDRDLRALLHQPGTSPGATDARIQLMDAQVTRMFTAAEKLAVRISDGIIATRHIVASLLYSEDPDYNPTDFQFEAVGLSLDDLVAIFRENIEKSAGLPPSEQRQEWSPILDQILLRWNQQKAPEPSVEVGSLFRPKRRAAATELGLHIDEYAKAIAETFVSAAEDDDFVFALYGPWGRGKTTLMEKVKQYLTGELPLSEGRSLVAEGYVPIGFSAWKYPARPEVWVHLYESIAAKASEGDRWQKYRLAFRIGLLGRGWAPLLWGSGLLLLSRFQLNVVEGLFTAFGLMGLAILASFGWNAVKEGKHLVRAYMGVPGHAEKLGLQAMIGSDLQRLLKIWIRSSKRAGSCCSGGTGGDCQTIDFRDGSPESRNRTLFLTFFCLTLFAVAGKAFWHGHLRVWFAEWFAPKTAPSLEQAFVEGMTYALLLGLGWLVIWAFHRLTEPLTQYNRVLLVVDDLDRCEPRQMLAIIESLRVFLDDPTMSSRLQVAMLVDRTILRRAILEKATQDGVLKDFEGREEEFFRSQEEKLFVASLALSPLTAGQAEDLAGKIIGKEVQRQKDVQVSPQTPASGETLPPGQTPPAVGAESGSSADEAGTSSGEASPPAQPPPQPAAAQPVPLSFTPPERALLEQVIKTIPVEALTPRSLRAFVVRYQLLRLLVGNLKQELKPGPLVESLATRLFGLEKPLPDGLDETVLGALDSVTGHTPEVK